MRAVLASPLGFLIGLALGALGGGGSIVAVPALVYVAGQEPAAATTTSLLVVGTAAVVGMVGHARAGRVRFGAGLVVGLTLILGFTMPQAIGTSLLVIAINAATALAARLGTTGVDWSVALPFTAAALAGVLTGSSIANRIDSRALVRWFAASLVALSLYITTTALISLA
jgi:uncharacterized membrane protein YfcA